jgi:hypothetical protein
VCFRNMEEIAETNAMKTMGSDRFSGRTRRTEAAIITEIAEELKKAASELYFAERSMPSTRVVTLAHLSFINCDIFIAIPGRGVTFEGGTNESVSPVEGAYPRIRNRRLP